MADLSAPAPIETAKGGDYLHSRARMPAAPTRERSEIVRQYLGWGAGALLALGGVALLFQIRAGWNDHREWVVAALTPVAVVAGLAIGHLVARGYFGRMIAPLSFVFLSFVLALFSFWRGYLTEGPDTGRDLLTSFAGVCIGIAMAWLVLMLLWVELKNPTRAPDPDV